MPKLPAVKPRQIIRFLEKNGFILDHTSGSHFIFHNSISRRRAVVPQHNRDLPKGTLIALRTPCTILPLRSNHFPIVGGRAELAALASLS
jgi:predicted RNA binding protein YcfA (HicA-like mRNA interferase family)